MICKAGKCVKCRCVDVFRLQLPLQRRSADGFTTGFHSCPDCSPHIVKSSVTELYIEFGKMMYNRTFGSGRVCCEDRVILNSSIIDVSFRA